jgi:hypothetical protein
MTATSDAPAVERSDEPIVGWRCWFTLPEELLLRPILMRGLAWKPREAVEAICPEEIHEPPADDCKCGIWCVCHPMLLNEIGWTTHPPEGIERLGGIMVVGEVSLWGRVVQHDRGWRASQAYPRHLYAFTDDPHVADTLRERYGVPVEYGADAERLRRLLPLPREAPGDSAAPIASPGRAAPSVAASPVWLRERLTQLAHRLPASLRLEAVRMVDEPAFRRWLDPYYGTRDDAVDAARAAADADGLHPPRTVVGHRFSERGQASRARTERRREARRLAALATMSLHAAVDDREAQRTLLWMLLAWRWRLAKALYAEVVRATADARRTRSLKPMKPRKLSPATRAQFASYARARRVDLSDYLESLANAPTPSYREFRRMLA